MKNATTTAPEEYPIHYDDYEYEADIYKKIYQFSTKLNIYLQLFTVAINLFHLAVLLREELRSISIYMIMTAICICDIINFGLDINEETHADGWLPDVFTEIRYDPCFRIDYGEVNPWAQGLATSVQISQRLSVWLAIQMALIRILTVVFPMSQFIQKLTKPKAAWFFILGLFLFWTLYSTWHFAFYRIMWLPDNLNKFCSVKDKKKVEEKYVLASPMFLSYLMDDLGFIEAIRKLIQTVLYPILTISLLVQLRVIKKRRANMRSNETDKSDSTTKLLLFMTVTFTLSEGLSGLMDLLMYNYEAIIEWNEDVSYWVSTFQYPVMNLRTLNAASHFLVCYLMSSQYRDALKNMFYDNAYCRNRKKIRKVDQTLTANSKSTRVSTLSRSSDY